jgi:hypothetical protein
MAQARRQPTRSAASFARTSTRTPTVKALEGREDLHGGAWHGLTLKSAPRLPWSKVLTNNPFN